MSFCVEPKRDCAHVVQSPSSAIDLGCQRVLDSRCSICGDTSENWMDIIDGAIENAEDENLEDAISIIKKYREKLRKYRACGLKKEGEFSYENLVFKYLRRNGYISKLENFKNEFADKKLSLEQEKPE